MIEELKMILDTIGDLSGIGLWVILGFMIYKLVMFMATTGSVVFISRLLIERLYQWAVTPKPPALVRFEKGEIHGICITADRTRDIIMECLKDTIGTATNIDSSYIHSSDALWLKNAIKEKKEREEHSETENN